MFLGLALGGAGLARDFVRVNGSGFTPCFAGQTGVRRALVCLSFVKVTGFCAELRVFGLLTSRLEGYLWLAGLED